MHKLIFLFFLLLTTTSTMTVMSSPLKSGASYTPLTSPFFWASSSSKAPPYLSFTVEAGTFLDKIYLETMIVPCIERLFKTLQDPHFQQQIKTKTFKNHSRKKGLITVSGKRFLKKWEKTSLSFKIRTFFDEYSRPTVTAKCLHDQKEKTISLNTYVLYGVTEEELIRTISHELFHMLGHHHHNIPNKQETLPYYLSNYIQNYLTKNL